MNTYRRQILIAGCVLPLAVSTACSPKAETGSSVDDRVLTPEEQKWKHKFRGIRGGQLVVDAFGEKRGVNIFSENGQRFFSSSSLGSGGATTHAYGAEFGVPISLRATCRKEVESGTPEEREKNAIRPTGPWGEYGGGIVVGDVTVPVAERIPDDILDYLRSGGGGGFRLKLRLADDTLLVGGDIESRPGYDPNNRDKDGTPYYVPAVHSHVGGDFDRALRQNNQLVHNGWYIDKKTGQKIETDF